MPEDRNRMVLAEDRPPYPTCPFCGCVREDSEWLHDGNRLSEDDLIEAMLSAFFKGPQPFAAGDLRAKMKAALGTAVRNMPYLAALRADQSDAGEAMRERCARVCDARIEGLEALGTRRGASKDCALYELHAAVGLIRSLSLTEESR